MKINGNTKLAIITVLPILSICEKLDSQVHLDRRGNQMKWDANNRMLIACIVANKLNWLLPMFSKVISSKQKQKHGSSIFIPIPRDNKQSITIETLHFTFQRYHVCLHANRYLLTHYNCKLCWFSGIVTRKSFAQFHAASAPVQKGCSPHRCSIFCYSLSEPMISSTTE